MCEDVSHPFHLILLGDFMMKLANASLALSTATFGLMLGVAQNAQAAVVSASVSGIVTNSTYNIVNIFNGQGLPGNKPSLTGNHAASTNTNAWRSATGFLAAAKPIQITFNFGSLRELGGLSFWNATTSSVNSDLFGVRNVTFEYNNGAGWNPLTPTSFNGGAWTGAFNQGGAGPQIVDFSLVKVTQVRFNVTSNYGADRLAINEVQFKTIPEPSASLALLALGLAGVGLRKRI